MLANKALSSAPSAEPVFVESVFSTYLYTGNGSTQTITNGIDLAGKGGLVWIKSRNASPISYDHVLKTDTTNNYLSSNTTNGNTFGPGQITAFNSNGFTLGDNFLVNDATTGYNSFVSWTFRKQAKFFDVVTYTGNGSNRTISHNLGSVPGCIIVKRTDTSADWQVYHRSIANTEYLVLNSTDAKATGTTRWNSTTPTSTVFSLGTDSTVNANGGTYVAYLFAHDAGGFGLTGTDNVISCGSYTGTGAAGNSITLGYEPQWVLVKSSTLGTASSQWSILDNMRGSLALASSGNDLFAQSSAAENTGGAPVLVANATGFNLVSSNDRVNGSGQTYIYIAIRRGPMKVPTSGTSVFTPTAFSGNGGSGFYSNGFPTDLVIHNTRNTAGLNHMVYDRLRGRSPQLQTNTTFAESGSAFYNLDQQNSLSYAGNSSGFNALGETYVDWNFRRAPGFFDVVCYTGTGSATTFSHNLGIAPELMIVKRRDSAGSFNTYVASVGPTKWMYLNADNAPYATSGVWNDTAPTASVFTVGTSIQVNASGGTYVAYLFATVTGVSKVGSYTGTGTTQTINCGFTGGARFVLIKRTDSTGDWYVWDSARGIVAGDDPYLLLNSTAAEVTNTDYIDTASSGFEISSTAPAAINANGGTFIFLAIA